MKKVDFYEYQKERRKFLGKRLSLGLKRLPANRPRDEEERTLLRRLDKVRWETWLSTGKLQKLGPRHYRFRK